jgi:hypothetical protein
MLPKNAYRSVQEVAENIRNCSVRINKIFAQHHCTQISVISILIPGATPAQNGRVNSPPHREAGGGLGKMGPQQDHRTESDFPASCTQRTANDRNYGSVAGRCSNGKFRYAIRVRLDLIYAAGRRQSKCNMNKSVPRHHAQLPLKRLCLLGHRPMLRMHRPRVLTPTAKASSQTPHRTRCRNRVPPRSAHGAMISGMQRSFWGGKWHAVGGKISEAGGEHKGSLIVAGERHGAGVDEIHAWRPLLHCSRPTKGWSELAARSSIT